MPEYIDKEKLIRDLIDNRCFYPAIVKSAIENAPTEDVVPRSECKQCEEVTFNALKDLQETFAKGIQDVAREIFEEIEKQIAYEDNIFEKCASRLVSSDYCNGRSETIGFVLNFLIDLKKKYMGE